jgi:hypothetical protein
MLRKRHAFICSLIDAVLRGVGAVEMLESDETEPR